MIVREEWKDGEMARDEAILPCATLFLDCIPFDAFVLITDGCKVPVG